MDASAEALADALVTQLNRGDTDPDHLLDRLRASRRPYYTWALAWAQWTGVLERHPGHQTARRAVTVLRAVEPAANRLDMVWARSQGNPGHTGTPRGPGHTGTPRGPGHTGTPRGPGVSGSPGTG